MSDLKRLRELEAKARTTDRMPRDPDAREAILREWWDHPSVREFWRKIWDHSDHPRNAAPRDGPSEHAIALARAGELKFVGGSMTTEGLWRLLKGE